MFTMDNLRDYDVDGNFITEEQVADMNNQLLELYPEADSDEADEQLVKHYSDQVMENGPRC